MISPVILSAFCLPSGRVPLVTRLNWKTAASQLEPVIWEHKWSIIVCFKSIILLNNNHFIFHQINVPHPIPQPPHPNNNSLLLSDDWKQYIYSWQLQTKNSAFKDISRGNNVEFNELCRHILIFSFCHDFD